jgi:hypothetical protein
MNQITVVKPDRVDEPMDRAQYALYRKIMKALETQIPIGIAS